MRQLNKTIISARKEEVSDNLKEIFQPFFSGNDNKNLTLITAFLKSHC